jgi:DNA-binding response OmpR family regulator
MPRLLVIDDESSVLYALEKGLRTATLEVITASTAKEGIELVQQHSPDAVILDVKLTDMSGLEAFEQIRYIDPHLPVLFITAHATTEMAIEAMKRGAFEYLLKPVELHQLREAVAKAIEANRLRHVPAVFEQEESQEEGSVDRIVGRNSAMQEVYKAIGRVAPLDVPVLIAGAGPAKSSSRAPCISTVAAPRRLTSPSTVLPFRKRCWKASCSVTSAPPLPEPTAAASASLNRRIAARFFSMKSATCRVPRRPRCCGCCRSNASNAWAAMRRFKPMSA